MPPLGVTGHIASSPEEAEEQRRQIAAQESALGFLLYQGRRLHANLFASQTPLVAAFRGLALVVFSLRSIREILNAWMLFALPFVVLASCVGLSGLASLYHSPTVSASTLECASRTQSSPMCSAVRSRSSQVLAPIAAALAPVLTRAKVEVRAGWKRVRPLLEAKAASAVKVSFALGNVLRAVGALLATIMQHSMASW